MDQKSSEEMSSARASQRPGLHGPDAASEPSAAVANWMIAHSYATGHGDTIEDMLGELEAQARERGQWPMTTWRGLCGHVWDRAIEDTADCPRCAVNAALAEAGEICAVLDLHNAHDGDEIVYDFEAIGEEVARRHGTLTDALAKTVGQ